MIQGTDTLPQNKLENAWEMAEEAQEHPTDALDDLFARYKLVERDVQFSCRAVPEGRWFIDWGLPRHGYGGYEVVESHHFGHVCASKLAPALCPECHSPIFTVLMPNGTGRHKAQQLCLSCGHWELLSLPR